MSASGVPCTTNAGTSGGRSFAWRPSVSPRGGHSGQLRRYDQEKSGPPYRRAGPLPQWRGLRPASIPHAAGWKLRAGHHAPPLRRWPGHCLSVPVGCERSLKAPQAQPLNVPISPAVSGPALSSTSWRRSDPGGPSGVWRTVVMLPRTLSGSCPRRSMVWAGSRSAPRAYELPPPPTPTRRGAPRKKGDLIGSPNTLAQTAQGGEPHPSEAGAEIQAWCGLWHPVVPGRLLRVVVIRRQGPGRSKRTGHHKPPPPVEAFFTPALALTQLPHSKPCFGFMKAHKCLIFEEELWKAYIVTNIIRFSLALPTQ